MRENLIECTCCGELVEEEEIYEDGLCYECYCDMFPNEF